MKNEMASKLLKCLKCRLTGSPPKFNLLPPPQPTEFIDIFVDGLDYDCTNKFDFTNFNGDNLSYHCRRFKELFYPSIQQVDFCTIIFIIVALVLLVKLFKIKKKFKQIPSYQFDKHRRSRNTINS